MICQICAAKEATNRVTERSRSGRFEEAHYCPECYEAKYLKPPPTACDFPRPRLRIKNVMILVGVWAIPNAVAAWVKGSGYLTGTPAQIRQWTINTFLGVNLVLGFLVVYLAMLAWLFRVIWYKRTGGLLPMPEQTPSPKQHATLIVRMLTIFAWIVASTLLELWLTPRIWPFQRHSHRLFVLIVCAPLLPILAIRLWSEHALIIYVRQQWRTAAWPERLSRALCIVWSIFLIIITLMGGSDLRRWGLVRWLPIPPFILVGVAIQIVLLAAVSLSIRRR